MVMERAKLSRKKKKARECFIRRKRVLVNYGDGDGDGEMVSWNQNG